MLRSYFPLERVQIRFACQSGKRTMTMEIGIAAPALSQRQQHMVAQFEKHVGAELEGDLDTTMATMSDEPHLHNVPTMIGGVGKDGVRAFYRDHLVGKFFPPDVTMITVSRTVGQDQIVD